MTALTNIQAALQLQGGALAAQGAEIQSIITDLNGIRGSLELVISSGANASALKTIADHISRNTAQLTAAVEAINAAILRDVQHADEAGSGAVSSEASTDAASTTSDQAQAAA